MGCGKTVVAFLAMLATVGSGFQAAMMAPTEVSNDARKKNSTSKYFSYEKHRSNHTNNHMHASQQSSGMEQQSSCFADQSCTRSFRLFGQLSVAKDPHGVPAQVLAEQHYKGLCRLLNRMPDEGRPSVAILTGSTKVGAAITQART